MTENFAQVKSFIGNSYLSKGFFKPSDFEVEFGSAAGEHPTIKKLGLDVNLFEKMKWNLKSIEVPGFTVETTKSPYRQNFSSRTLNDITTTFYESSDLEIRRNLYTWINAIVQYDSKENNYKRHYFNDVVIDIRVKQILPGGKLSEKNTWELFRDAFPVSVNNVTFDTTTEDEIGTTVVTWRYMYHTIGDGQNSPGWT